MLTGLTSGHTSTDSPCPCGFCAQASQPPRRSLQEVAEVEKATDADAEARAEEIAAKASAICPCLRDVLATTSEAHFAHITPTEQRLSFPMFPSDSERLVIAGHPNATIHVSNLIFCTRATLTITSHRHFSPKNGGAMRERGGFEVFLVEYHNLERQSCMLKIEREPWSECRPHVHPLPVTHTRLSDGFTQHTASFYPDISSTHYILVVQVMRRGQECILCVCGRGGAALLVLRVWCCVRAAIHSEFDVVSLTDVHI